MYGRKKKKNGGVSYRSIDRAELTESRSVSPIEANSNGETRGETSELSRRPSSSLFPRTFLSWFLALVAALSFSPPSCLFYFRVVSSPGNSMNSKQLSQCRAIEFFPPFFFLSFQRTFVFFRSINQTRLCAFAACANLDQSRRNVTELWQFENCPRANRSKGNVIMIMIQWWKFDETFSLELIDLEDPREKIF